MTTDVFEPDLMVKTSIEPTTDNSREVAMWCAVIEQALLDALGRANAAEAAGCSPTSELEIHEARVWFVRGGKDFREICILAGTEPELVRKTVLQRLADVLGLTPSEVVERYDPKPKPRRRDSRGRVETFANSLGTGAGSDAQH